MRPVRILVFAKAPCPGLAKTRLIPALGPWEAAALAQRMLDRTLAAALAASVGPVELCATPDIGAPAWQGIPLPDGIAVTAQGSGDLGERMARAAARAIGNGAAALLVGTDCAEMDASLLRDAAAALEHADGFIHPTADGGYALLGLTRFDCSLFDDIRWSTDSVARTTIARIRAQAWRLEIGRTLHDIDDPADLVHLPDGMG